MQAGEDPWHAAPRHKLTNQSTSQPPTVKPPAGTYLIGLNLGGSDECLVAMDLDAHVGVSAGAPAPIVWTSVIFSDPLLNRFLARSLAPL